MITDTVALLELATYIFAPLGVATIPTGLLPTETVVSIAFVAVLITVTVVPPLKLETYNLDPSGVVDKPYGAFTPGIVVTTLLVEASMTVTLLLLKLAT